MSHIRECLVAAASAFFLSCAHSHASSTEASLTRAIGIMTLTGFSEMIPAGKNLPQTYSETFGNAADNQAAIRITIVQADRTGTEQILVADIDNLPARPKGKLNVIVTITVDVNKQLRLKATVPETGYVKQFGPLPVT
jgi:molecular chaperone DnaK (HSP70)